MSGLRVHTIPDFTAYSKISGEGIKKVADSYARFTGYVWTEAASGKKQLRIQKYPDTCGLGLNETILKNIIT